MYLSMTKIRVNVKWPARTLWDDGTVYTCSYYPYPLVDTHQMVIKRDRLYACILPS